MREHCQTVKLNVAILQSCSLDEPDSRTVELVNTDKIFWVPAFRRSSHHNPKVYWTNNTRWTQFLLLGWPVATGEPLQLHRFRCNKNLPVHIFVFQTLALHIFVFQHHDPPEGFQDLKKEQMIRIDIWIYFSRKKLMTISHWNGMTSAFNFRVLDLHIWLVQLAWSPYHVILYVLGTGT